ncbi:hypothetical protein [Spiroplasma ixodetis]|uniref:hypothetical protein n=1 Tax=Spiroplasma ixodetis TaxID=2141 RepID=UPI002575CE44|nr:hypothetical protein [Spiroplasma ixodetis]WJG70214.1 hypothetical protein SIXOD_v1c12930 [Spiroplasma ixodetis Y32]WJG70455.1 hypothetical protein SIXOD_v1c16150 [Spiroplasma ixodetis Y32]
MIIHKCNYCKTYIMDGDWVKNSLRFFKITIKTYWYMHRICFIQYENEKLNKVNEIT